MKQSEAQRIGARANDIFTYQRPQNWIFRSQQDMDFGVDYEIEIFDKKGVSTGLIAKIQLKGSENIKYIDNKTKISFSFPMDNAQYLIEEIQIPSYLIICDNNSEKCYWSSFKTNAELKKSYVDAKNNNQENFSVHIDVNNLLVNDYDAILKDIELSLKFIGLESLKKINFYDYSELLNSINIEEAKKSLLLQLENIDLQEIMKAYATKQFECALRLIEKGIKSEDKTIFFKFNAILFKRSIFRQIIAEEQLQINQKTDYLNEIYLNISNELIETTKDLPDGDTTKIYAQLWHHIATMAIISNALQWHKINLKMHEAEPTEFSDFWIVNVSAKIQQLFVEIANEFNEVQKNIDELINNQDYRFFIELLPEFIFSITGFLFFLNEELEESFTKIENYFDLLTDLAFNLIKNIDLQNKWDRYEYLLKTRIAYKGFYINKDYKKSLEIFKKDVYPVAFQIEDSTLRKDMLIYIKKYIQNIKSSYENNIDEIPIEEEIEIYRANLTAMGVNLDNPSNDTDKAIKEAFEALNPERVLKNCIHLYACQSIVSPLGQWVKLNTLGVKRLYCAKNKYSAENVFLDNLWQYFDWNYCSKCKDREAHDENWKWSRKWQREQDQKNHNGR